jgi:hypothetical protein
MTIGSISNSELASLRKRYQENLKLDAKGIPKKAKTAVEKLQAEIIELAQKKARELSKEAGIKDPVALDAVKATNIRKDPDGNYLFNY